MNSDKVNISGYGDDLTINNIRIGDLSPYDHENIEKKHGGNNYSPLEDVVVSHVKDSSTLICRKPASSDIEKYVESELLDGLCCYSAVNQGQLNQTIVDAVLHHLSEEKLPMTRLIDSLFRTGFRLFARSFDRSPRVLLCRDGNGRYYFARDWAKVP